MYVMHITHALVICAQNELPVVF